MTDDHIGEILVNIGGHIYPVDLSDEIQNGICCYGTQQQQQQQQQFTDAWTEAHETSSPNPSCETALKVWKGIANSCTTSLPETPGNCTTLAKDSLDLVQLYPQEAIEPHRTPYNTDAQDTPYNTDAQDTPYNTDAQDTTSCCLLHAIGLKAEATDRGTCKWPTGYQKTPYAHIANEPNFNVQDMSDPIGLVSSYDFSDYYAPSRICQQKTENILFLDADCITTHYPPSPTFTQEWVQPDVPVSDGSNSDQSYRHLNVSTSAFEGKIYRGYYLGGAGWRVVLSCNVDIGPRDNVKRGCKIWEFIRNLLLDPATNPSLICWENQEEGAFRFIQPATISRMWGQRKRNQYMTYEKLSRAMRYHYKKKALAPVKGHNHIYRFGPSATGWK